ncbi:hypothetical protein M4R22_00550 [Acidovorax sp. GBBC 3334]|uniref:hypothetical protein n=1 Tax=Acidovorax sp. GBBC 3334 TaxID=2940496 RepID=UPI00230497A7|nr:hypothetical protein [Acidovorax sp. GBBC 3334]MDA8453241.1 hypothetical protein [Acidovorax sp. GBBC 3334]
MPTTALTDTVVRIGNTSGAEIDKFQEFGLTADDGQGIFMVSGKIISRRALFKPDRPIWHWRYFACTRQNARTTANV